MTRTYEEFKARREAERIRFQKVFAVVSSGDMKHFDIEVFNADWSKRLNKIVLTDLDAAQELAGDIMRIPDSEFYMNL
jgi:hypothetical protein